MAVQTKLRNLFNLHPILNSRFALISTETRSKLESIPEKPKRPATPFFRFLHERRAEVVKNNPKAKVGDIAKILGAEWKTVGADLKKKYEKAYETEMVTYTKRHLEYMANLTAEQRKVLEEAAKERKRDKETRKLNQFFKETNKPKKFKLAHMFYVLEKSDNAKGGLKEALAKCKGQWAALPESEKKRYIKMEEEDRKRYERELNAWEARMIAEGRTDVVRKTTLDDQKKPASSKPRKAKAAAQ